jgi:nucleotide-binding universal stress UspA family protein
MNGFNKILVPIDFSERSITVLRNAVYVAGKFEAELNVIFVVEDFSGMVEFSVPHISSDIQDEDMKRGAEKKMEHFLEENLGSSVAFKGKVLIGNVAEKISHFAKAEGIDLIIMGTHGYKGLERMLLGSVTEKVLRMAPCPVLTINTFSQGATG